MKKIVISAFTVAMALVCACSGPQSTTMITKGSASKFDSLSYALGANVGFSMIAQMADVPFDYESIGSGLEAAAFDKSDVTSDAALETLRTYFMTTRAERAEIVEKKRAEADSIALANGKEMADIIAARAALKADADMFESEDQRTEVSYAFGVDLGTNIKNSDIPVQTYWLTKAMVDTRDNNSQMDNQEAMNYLRNYFEVVRPAEMKAAAEELLASKAKESGVTKTESGLMYRVEVKGDDSVIATDDRDVVKVHYTGRLMRNNEVFDTSRFADRPAEQQEMLKAQDPEGYADDQPIEFPLNRVIPGWTEGMKFVGKGGRISLWIPAELAYGEQGAGQSIGPNEALYFDVEIVDVTPYTEVE